jgi:TRAP-type C4-dicarboxylate transport system permease small subunit
LYAGPEFFYLAAYTHRSVGPTIMNSVLKRSGAWLYRRAENAIAAMVALIFVAFVLQIVFRYVINLPIGWTNEFTVILWLWIVLFGAAFVVREEEEIRFDLIFSAVGPKARRAMFLVSSVALLILYGMSFPAVLDYVTFMKVESTAYLDIRFDWLYSIYIIFVVATIARYLWLSWQAMFGKAPQDFDPTKAGSGV